VWDVTTLKPVCTLSGHRNYVHGLAPRGHTLYSASLDGCVRVRLRSFCHHPSSH
jgi:WD40 repeat protein